MNLRRIATALFVAISLSQVLAHTARAAEALAVDFDGMLYDLNVLNGSVSNPRPTGISTLSDIAWSPSGVLYGHDAATNYLHRINRLTGESTPIGFMGVDVTEGDLAFNPTNGLLYGTQTVGGDRLYTIDTATGHATIIGTIIQNGDISGMAFGPDGTLYCVDTDNATLLTVDPATAQVINSISFIGDITPTSAILTAGLSVNPDTGRLHMVSDFFLGSGVNPFYWITPSNGFLRPVGTQGTGVTSEIKLSGLEFVPEPSSLALLSAGGIALMSRRRRR